MSTFCADGLIPARFLCLVAHFIMLVMALNYRVMYLSVFEKRKFDLRSIEILLLCKYSSVGLINDKK